MTVPHKTAVISMMARTGESAELTGAVNTNVAAPEASIEAMHKGMEEEMRRKNKTRTIPRSDLFLPRESG